MLRILKWIFGSFLALFSVFALILVVVPDARATFGLLVWAIQADVTRPSLVKKIHAAQKASNASRWGELIDLDPIIITPDKKLQSAVRRLEEAGFIPLGEGEDYYSMLAIGELPSGYIGYKYLWGGMPCNTNEIVFLWADDRGALIAAKTATFEAGCL